VPGYQVQMDAQAFGLTTNKGKRVSRYQYTRLYISR
jgi:hypothetical protein